MQTAAKQKAVLFVNFGGPRLLPEIPEFLTSLLTDKDVIRTPFPSFLQDLFFTKIAKKRAKTLEKDYLLIGGRSPIYDDTEQLSNTIQEKMGYKALTFHRYLPSTHESFLEQIHSIQSEEIIVFPLFPQFTYATTGSIARWFQDHLSQDLVRRLQWIKSYPSHPSYIYSMISCIKEFLQQHFLDENKTFLFFSPHGLPKTFISEGDIYLRECTQSFEAIRKAFPSSGSLMGFQSKFGKGEWLRPYTNELCEKPLDWIEEYENVVFIPLSFTSDHIETLFEVEYQYLPLIQKAGIKAFRCPALCKREDWIQAIEDILLTSDFVSNQMLVRHTR